MLQGKPSQTTEADTMRAIRDILSGSDAEAKPVEAKRRAAPRPSEVEPGLTLIPVREINAKVTMSKFTTVPSGEAPEQAPEIIRNPVGSEAQPKTQAAPANASKPRHRRFALSFASLPSVLPAGLRRAAPRWGAIAVLFGCAMLYPALVVVPVALTLFVVIGAFVLLGGERVWTAVSKALEWYARRRPARAQRLLARLDAFAVRWDAILDRFPDGSVDGLYMPDLTTISERSGRVDPALARRLERMHTQV